MQYINCRSVTICEINKIYGELPFLETVVEKYPFRLSPQYARLICRRDDPVWRQCIPDIREISDDGQSDDPLAENNHSPVPGLIHRYPDRAVLLVSNRCPVYCRFCMRKRHVGGINEKIDLDAAFLFLAATPAIRDVILSGGDPLMLEDRSLFTILTRLRSIPHIDVIRIGTRMPVTMPERITPELCRMFRRFHPLYINTHFNHPVEISSESVLACELLADAGIPLGNQTVLLKGVNDDCRVMSELMTGLLKIRVKPYYIHQMDLVKGTAHFRTTVSRGVEIMKSLRGHISGMAVPHYMIDLPGGKGKVPVLPENAEMLDGLVWLTTYKGERFAYPDITVPPE